MDWRAEKGCLDKWEMGAAQSLLCKNRRKRAIDGNK